MLSVVTWLWNDEEYRYNHLFRYGAAHVDKFFRAVDRNLKLEHENVLITDAPSHVQWSNVDRVIPLWPDFRNLPGWRGKGHGCWHRLKAFDHNVGRKIGNRFVWFDLDTVITGELDPILDRPEDFVVLRDANPPTPYCGSMVMMDAGARQSVWEDFCADPSAAIAASRGLIGTDQAWMGRHLSDSEAVWDTSHGVYNFQHDIERKHNGELPSNARVVFFTGPRDPSQPELQSRHPWIKEHWR